MTRPADRPTPERDLDELHPNRVAVTFARLAWHRQVLTADIGVVLTDRRLFALALVAVHPISAGDVAAFVRKVDADLRFSQFARLRHRKVAYTLLHSLDRADVLERSPLGGRVMFHLRPPVRRTLQAVIRT